MGGVAGVACIVELPMIWSSRRPRCGRPVWSCIVVGDGQFWRHVARVSSSSPNWRIEVDRYDAPCVLVDVSVAVTYHRTLDYSWMAERRRVQDSATRRAGTLRKELRKADRRRAPRAPKVLDPIGTPAVFPRAGKRTP